MDCKSSSLVKVTGRIAMPNCLGSIIKKMKLNSLLAYLISFSMYVLTVMGFSDETLKAHSSLLWLAIFISQLFNLLFHFSGLLALFCDLFLFHWSPHCSKFLVYISVIDFFVVYELHVGDCIFRMIPRRILSSKYLEFQGMLGFLFKSMLRKDAVCWSSFCCRLDSCLLLCAKGP